MAQLKDAVADALVAEIQPIRDEMERLREDTAFVDQVGRGARVRVGVWVVPGRGRLPHVCPLPHLRATKAWEPDTHPTPARHGHPISNR